MPTLPVYAFEQELDTDPSTGTRLSAVRPYLDVDVPGLGFRPYVLLDPGRPFSVVSHTVAATLGWSPAGVTADPVDVYEFDLSAGGMAWAGQVPADDLTRWDGHPGGFGVTEVELLDRSGHGRTGRLAVFASRPDAAVPQFADGFIILGMSFLRDNRATLSLTHQPGRCGSLDL
jgi:hypothetical protein